MKKKINIFFVLCFCFYSRFAFAEDHFPFLAEVSAPNVNIRAGQDFNFEKLGRLTKGSAVIVVGKSYSWYKIKLPSGAQSYVSQDFVEVGDLSSGEGLIKADRVNIRAGAGQNFTAMGQLKKGSPVKILEKISGWYRIEPIEGTYGWISQQYLTFKSNQVPSVTPASIEPVAKSSSSIALASQTEMKIIKSLEPASTRKNTGPLSVTGRLENLDEGGFAKDIRHKLILDDHTTFYLKGYKNVIDSFSSYRVQVEGQLQDDPRHPSPYPVIVVSRINLVL